MEDKILDFISKNRNTFQNVEEEYKCTLCKQILRDPYISKCLCNFCKECITIHFREGNTCLGENEDCRDVNLENGQFAVNHHVNKKIRKMETYCPNNDCKFQSSLENVVVHLEECGSKRKFSCSEESKEKRMEENLNDIKNEIMKLKNESNERRESERKVYDKINLLQSTNDDLVRKVKDVRNENSELQHKIGEIENINIELSEKVDHIININAVLQSKIEELEGRNKELTEKMEKIKNKLEIKNIRNENDLLHLRQTQSGSNLKQSEEQNINKVKSNAEIMSRLSALETFHHDCESYIWKVESLPAKRTAAQRGENMAISSKEFYINRNGYKMQIEIYPNGVDEGEDSHLSVYFCICRGIFDDILEWPLKRTVKICLINPTNLTEENTEMFNYETAPEDCKNSFYKPRQNSDNESYGIPEFISWEELQGPNSPMKNEIIFIKLTLEK